MTFLAGSFVWTSKIIFDEGKRMPRITSFKLPNAGKDGAPATALAGREGVAGGGSVMSFSAAASEASSARPVGNLPT